MLFRDVADDVLKYVAPLKRAKTQKNYHSVLPELIAEIGHWEIDSFGNKEYMDWIADFKKKKCRETFFDYTKFINIVFKYAYKEKFTTHFKVFPCIDGERQTFFRVYTMDEIFRLAIVMNGAIKLQFVLAFECFMRLREVLHLTWDRIDFENMSIILRAIDVKTGKKKKRGRIIPMSRNAYEMLLELKKHSTTRFVFPSPIANKYVDSNKYAWAKAKIAAGIRGRGRWHDIRHTAISYALLVLKICPIKVSQVSGVSLQTIMKVYLHSDIKQLREVTEKMDVYKKVS